MLRKVFMVGVVLGLLTVLILSFGKGQRKESKTLLAASKPDVTGIILNDAPEKVATGQLMVVRVQPQSPFMGNIPRAMFLDPTSCPVDKLIMPQPMEPFVAKAVVFRAEEGTWFARPGDSGGAIAYFIQPKCAP